MMSRKSAPQKKGKATSGGGLLGNKVKKVTPVAGGDNRAVNPGYAGVALGGMYGKNPTPMDGGPGYKPNVSDGNYRAWTCPQGPGGGRTVYRSGTQGLRGPVEHSEDQRVPDPPATEPTGSFSDQVKPR